MTTKLKDAKQARDIAEHRLAEVRATVEAKALEKTRQLIEAPQPVMVPWREYPGFDDWGMSGTPYGRPYIWTNVDDRIDGRYLPLYENAHDVRRIRAESRKLVELFPVAKGALQKLSDYVLGNGFDFEVQPKNENDLFATQLAAVVQAKVDEFLECNNFIGNLDREIHEESRIDGDVFPTLYRDGERVRIELTDPACIAEPVNRAALERMLGTHGKLNHWWHGVHTLHNHQLKRDDVTRPLGYHAVFDRIGDQWDYLPVWRVEQIKRNVGGMARVGVPDFLSVQQDLENEGKVRRNTAEGAAILAAIVMIRQHAEGTTKSSIESMVAGNSTYSYEKPIKDGTRTTQGEQVQPGTVKDIPHGLTATTGPLGTLRSPVYIEVAQYLLRIIGSPWSMPEYLISGDASNANYASTLVSESPFVKYCEHEQAFYAGHFERLIWKAMKLYYELGAFRSYGWQQIRTLLEIKAQYTSPASRDKAEQATTNATLHEKGIMSKRTWASDSGLDYDEEQKNIATEPKPAPPPMVGLNGQPSPFGTSQPFARTEARESSLAIRAMETLLESCGTELFTEHAGPGDHPSGSSQDVHGDSGGLGSGGERGATAIHKGDKFRVISPRAKINVDQMADLMGERGYKVGKPEYSLKMGATLYPVAKDGQSLLVPAKAIQKFLTTELDDIRELK